MAPKIQKKEASPKGGNGKPKQSTAAGVQKRSESWVINRYLLKSKKKTTATKRSRDVGALQARVDAITEALAKGTKTWLVPTGRVTAGEKRESVEKEIALRPTEVSKLLQKKAALESRIANGGGNRKGSQARIDLRAEFLKVLPVWAKRHGHSIEILRAIGISETDLMETGFVVRSVSEDPEIENIA